MREGVDLKAPQLASRLSTGAVVKELALVGERLQYERLTGSGPDTGWVSIRLKDKDLLVKTNKAPDAIPRAGETALSLEGDDRYVVRWAVNINEWTPIGEEKGEEFQFLLNLIEPEDERASVLKYKRYEDKKRTLVSRLLMRKASAHAIRQINFKDIVVKRTKGKKPFLASPLPPESEAPNWNANPSHEGDWVVCASEPFCICGIDIAEVRRLTPKGQPIDFYKNFADQLTEVEWKDVKKGGASPDDLDGQYEVFARYWSAKEAFSKARGDGLGFPLQDAEFHWKPTPGFPPKTAYEGTVKVKGEEKPLWRLFQHKLHIREPHWVTVARGPLTDIVDAKGEFTKTLRKTQDTFSKAAWNDILNAKSSECQILPIAALVPLDVMEDYVKAGGSRFPQPS